MLYIIYNVERSEEFQAEKVFSGTLVNAASQMLLWALSQTKDKEI